MKPIFFPFTSLTRYDADCLLNVFETFSYLSTSSSDELAISEPEWFQTLWRSQKAIEPVTLSQEELTPLLGSIKSWRAWADTNCGKQTRSGYLQSIFRENPYFTSDSDIFAIRSQIEKGIAPIQTIQKQKHLKSGGDDYKTNVDNAFLFLRLAAMADHDNEEVGRKLLSINRLEANVLAELQGGYTDSSWIANNASDYGTGEFRQYDRGELMTEQRIRSWLYCFMAKKDHFNESSTPYHFITTSRSVIDFLLSGNEKSKLMLDIDNFKVHKEKNSTAHYELFQITEQELAVMLVGLKK